MLQGKAEVITFAHPTEAAEYIEKNRCSVLILDNNYEKELPTDRMLRRNGLDFGGLGDGGKMERGLGLTIAKQIQHEGQAYSRRVLPVNKRNMVVVLYTADPNAIPKTILGDAVFSVMNSCDNSKVAIASINVAIDEHVNRSSRKGSVRE